MGAGQWRRVAAVALFAAVALSALGRIRSYDFFWHLATGHWIAEHRALPATDPFAVASDRVPWINGEWLFQVALVPIHTAGGITAIAWGRALLVALIFTLAYLAASKEGDWALALCVAAVAFAGAHERLDARPSTAAALLAAGAIVLAARRTRLAWTALIVLTIVWMNTHPSALLAPAIALIAGRSIPLAAVSAAALLVNPHGWRGIAAPIELTRFATSGLFTNAEWLPSAPAIFPLFYITVVAGAAACLLARKQRDDWWRFLLFAMFAALAIRHVRNQGLYFATLPVLIAPLLKFRVPRAEVALAFLIPIAWVFAREAHRPEADPNRFPIQAVARLKQAGFEGNLYNPDQLGGYLIWSFYPERRALTDGRNELYRTYIPEYARARADNRAWTALLRKYQIDIAVDEYRRESIEVLDFATKQRRRIAASLVYFPRAQWALIAYDRAAMVFVRRAAFSAGEIARWEIRGVRPDE
jgi:hypothetical protein